MAQETKSPATARSGTSPGPLASGAVLDKETVRQAAIQTPGAPSGSTTPGGTAGTRAVGVMDRLELGNGWRLQRQQVAGQGGSLLVEIDDYAAHQRAISFADLERLGFFFLAGGAGSGSAAGGT